MQMFLRQVSYFFVFSALDVFGSESELWRGILGEWKLQAIFSFFNHDPTTMARRHIHEQHEPHFLTFTVTEWVDVFLRDRYRTLVLDTFQFYREQRNLKIYGYVIMPNHLHLLWHSQTHELSAIVRDFKRWTCRKIIDYVQEVGESRREWMIPVFAEAGRKNPDNEIHQVWIGGSWPRRVYGSWFAWQKLDYIHWNPVKAGLVRRPEDYVYSSASNFVEGEGVFDVDPWPFGPRT